MKKLNMTVIAVVIDLVSVLSVIAQGMFNDTYKAAKGPIVPECRLIK